MERGESFTSAMREALSAKSESIKHSSGRIGMVFIPELSFQYLFGMRGVTTGALVDIIGPDQVGKTTLLYTWSGWFMSANCPVAIVRSENKPMDPDRVMTCLHRDRKTARQMYNVLYQVDAYEMTHAIDIIEKWAMQIRNPENEKTYWPLDLPCLVGLDSFSKLMPPNEMAAFQAYLDDGVIAKDKESDLAAQGSNMGPSKVAHAWARRLPYLLNRYNIVLVTIRHQNDKVDMTKRPGGGGNYETEESKASKNRTSLGGRAFNQNAAYQIILNAIGTEQSQIKKIKTDTLKLIQATTVKNSYTPGRKIKYAISLVALEDTESTHTPALAWWPGYGDLMELWSGILPVTKHNNNSYTVKEFKLAEASREEIHSVLHKPENWSYMIHKLGIKGREEFYHTIGLPAELQNFFNPPPAPPPVPVITATQEDSEDEAAETPPPPPPLPEAKLEVKETADGK